jgi:serine/threonine protein kinase
MLPGVARGVGEAADSSAIVKVVDFGLARLSPQGNHQLTTLMCRDGATMGTPAFISPEQIRNIHNVDIRSDLYSLGCSFYFALTGYLPFQGITTQATLALHLEREPRPMQSWRAEVPIHLARIIQRLMAKNPADRYQTPAELIEVINNFILSGDLWDCEHGITLPRAGSLTRRQNLGEEDHPTPLDISHCSDDSLNSSNLSSTDVEIAAVALRELWTQWREVLGNFIQYQQYDMQEDDYKSLYRNLLDAVRAVRSATPNINSDLYRQLQIAVEPWVSSLSLISLDRSTLLSLWQTCRKIDSGIWPQREKPPSSRFALLACISIFALVLLGVMWSTIDKSRFIENLANFFSSKQHITGVLMIPVILLFAIIIGKKGIESFKNQK